MKTTDAKPVKPTPQELRKLARERFLRSRRAGSTFGRQLSKLGRSIGNLINKHAPGGTIKNWKGLHKALNDYAKLIRPWAASIAEKMHTEVAQRDAQAWYQASQQLGQHLRKEIAKAPVGKLLRKLSAEQADLISSMPIEAAQRIRKLTLERITQGKRPEELAKQIAASGEVSIARARLIARTETARTAALLTEVRAKHIGSEGYIWRTSLDTDVRPKPTDPNYAQLNTLAMGSHRKLEGTFHRWDAPPIVAPTGERAHPGCWVNCRCWAEPVLPDRV